MDLHVILSISSQTIIGISGLLIITGVMLILNGYKDYHKKAMLSASAFALVFVVLYLINSSLFPHKKYTGNYRTLYFLILWSHTILALINLPLAVVTVYRGLKGAYDKHKKIYSFNMQ